MREAAKIIITMIMIMIIIIIIFMVPCIILDASIVTSVSNKTMSVCVYANYFEYRT